MKTFPDSTYDNRPGVGIVCSCASTVDQDLDPQIDLVRTRGADPVHQRAIGTSPIRVVQDGLFTRRLVS